MLAEPDVDRAVAAAATRPIAAPLERCAEFLGVEWPPSGRRPPTSSPTSGSTACADYQAVRGRGVGPTDDDPGPDAGRLGVAADLGAGAEGGRQPPGHRRHAQAAGRQRGCTRSRTGLA